MQGFILFLFLFGQLGPHSDVQPFDTLEECEEAAAAIPGRIAEHNHSADNAKIFLYAAVCKEVEKAPLGKEI